MILETIFSFLAKVMFIAFGAIIVIAVAVFMWTMLKIAWGCLIGMKTEESSSENRKNKPNGQGDKKSSVGGE